MKALMIGMLAFLATPIGIAVAAASVVVCAAALIGLRYFINARKEAKIEAENNACTHQQAVKQRGRFFWHIIHSPRARLFGEPETPSPEYSP